MNRASLARHCPACHHYQRLEWVPDAELRCPACEEQWSEGGFADETTLERCPICTCRQFYLAKDFSHALGCAVMLVGIVLVPWTYGLSLPLFAGIDWLIHRRVRDVIVCYRCGSEFRNVTPGKKLKPFMHHIGLKYDKYR